MLFYYIMGYLRTMGAGLGGSTSRGVNVNQIQYGDKLQGLPPVTGNRRPYGVYKSKAGGNAPDRFRVFCINQLGGVGRGRSQFESNSDSVGWCPNKQNKDYGNFGINKVDRTNQSNRFQSSANQKVQFLLS